MVQKCAYMVDIDRIKEMSRLANEAYNSLDKLRSFILESYGVECVPGKLLQCSRANGKDLPEVVYYIEAAIVEINNQQLVLGDASKGRLDEWVTCRENNSSIVNVFFRF